MALIRPAAVAGMFYPGDRQGLAQSVAGFVNDAAKRAGIGPNSPIVKAVIAPHAGYVYSGACAGEAYARLLPGRDAVTRVVLMGPCHRVALRGLATTAADLWQTPLGSVPIDREALDGLSDLPQVFAHDAAHKQEHSLEVHLPFLQTVFPKMKLVPFAVGQASAEDVAAVLDRLWGGPETRIVISSDLSHFLDYDACNALDAKTADAVERFDYAAIGRDQACGRIPMSGLLKLAPEKHLSIERVGLCNSGDTAGDKGRTVGYGAWVFRA
ncbi:AmmeMemoRadiSam system protein B [Rhodospirillaceae bacterium KN72]|uniref:MEMO1 family protein HH303_08080 n=2 Tax=Pacificispira spongiicola TaxID=2729598 RepID=A0A7Y0DZF4_9PROT|nr:AmmeMemoRadiSam system protein B [Pacificispira spongiicola]